MISAHPPLRFALSFSAFGLTTEHVPSPTALRKWAFAFGIRMGDQNRPLALKLAVELMLLVHALATWLRSSAAPAAVNATPAMAACADHAAATLLQRRSLRRRSAASGDVDHRADRRVRQDNRVTLRRLAGRPAARLPLRR